MTLAINDLSKPLSGLNIFDDPTPWNQVRVAGLLVLATAVKFNGLKVEDVWKMQKSKNASGAVFSFGGTNPVGGESGFSITFRITLREEFAQLYEIYDALKPVPVFGGGAASNGTSKTPATYAVGSPQKPASDSSAEALLAQAQAAMKQLNSPTPAASSADAADKQAAATAPQPSPGPRPPTVPIELGWLAFLGVFAVARKWWDFSTIEQTDTDAAHIEVTIGFVQDKPPTPAGSGAMAAPKPAAAKYVDTAASASTSAAKKGAAGT